MINEINISIRHPLEGYYLRWYYNGWHYWHFIPGKQSLITSGQKYNTVSQKQVNVSSGIINEDRVLSLRTITCSKEVSLYSADGWMSIKLTPGTFEVKNNYIDGYEIELVITVGSREASETGYSPVIILPEPPPKTSLYGLLYNWYAATDSRGLALEGWHVPSMDEWNTLNTYLGSDSVAAPKIKAVDNWGIFCSTTDSSGFTALPAGVRDLNTSNGHPAEFIGRTLWSCFRSTQVVFKSIPTIMSMYYNDDIIHLEFYPPNTKGYSVRCVRDSSEGWTSGETVKDYDGNVYHTIQIGDQIWLKESLAVTHYKNGDIIPEVTDATEWEALTTGALCAYDNNWTNVFES